MSQFRFLSSWKAQEKHLEDLLFSHPYLIDPEFTGLIPERQKTKGRNRLDLFFNLPSGLCIVELKKTPLTLNNLKQLLRYCRDLSQQGSCILAGHHYLVGKRPLAKSRLIQEASQAQFEIRIRFIGEHIPLQLAWDASARRYSPFDDNCPTADYITLKL